MDQHKQENGRGCAKSAPPPPAFCMPVLPISNTETAKKRLSTPAGSYITHQQIDHPKQTFATPSTAQGSSNNRPPIPEFKLPPSSHPRHTVSFQPSATNSEGLLQPQVPSATTSALVSPRQLAPNPDSPARPRRYTTEIPPPLPPRGEADHGLVAPPRAQPTLTHYYSVQPLLPPPMQLPPLPQQSLGGSSESVPTRGSRSVSQPPVPPNIRAQEETANEILKLRQQLKAAQDENLKLSHELSKAKLRIKELESRKKKKEAKEKSKQKKKEADKEEERKRKEKEKEGKKEKEEKERKEKEEKEEKERKEKEERKAKKEAKHKSIEQEKAKEKLEKEEKEKHKKERKEKKTPRGEKTPRTPREKIPREKSTKAKTPRDKSQQDIPDEKKKGSIKRRKHKDGHKEVVVGAPKAGAWMSKTSGDSVNLPYGGADTPPPSREVLLSENKRALEIIEYNSNYYPPEIKAEIDELVRQEESDIDGLVHAIAGLERLAQVYEKSGEAMLMSAAQAELQEKKDKANLKGYVVANLLNRKAYIIRLQMESEEFAALPNDIDIPEGLPAPIESPVKPNTAGGIIREPPRPPSVNIPEWGPSSKAPEYVPPTAQERHTSGETKDVEEDAIQSAVYLIGLFPFPGTGEEEMPIIEGDRIRLVDKVSDTWWKGANRGIIGLFPSNHTRPVNPNEKIRLGVTLFDREVQADPEQLSFKKGARVRLLDSPGETDEWVKGRLDDDTVGWIPKAYLSLC